MIFEVGQVVRLRKLEKLVEDGVITNTSDLFLDRKNECFISKKMKENFDSETRLVKIKENIGTKAILSEDDVVYYKDWFEPIASRDRYVYLKNDEHKHVYKIEKFIDIHTVVLDNGNSYDVKNIDFDAHKFKVGDKVKLKDDILFNVKYNGVTLSKYMKFDIGIVDEVDDDNTVSLTTNIEDVNYWYGIDCLEKCEKTTEETRKFERNEKIFKELESNPIKIVKVRDMFDKTEVRIKIEPNQSELRYAIDRAKNNGEIVWFDNSQKIKSGMALTLDETKQLIEYLTKLVNVIEDSIADECEF